MKLYEATEALAIVEELLIESGGELTPEIEELLAQAEGDFAAKVERVALKVRELTAAAAIVKEEKARLDQRAQGFSRAAEGLKRYLEGNLRAAGKTKVEGELATVALQKNPPSLIVPESATQEVLAELYEAGMPGIELVPATYAVNKRELLDRVKVLEATGGTAADVLPEGWAVARGESLRIR